MAVLLVMVLIPSLGVAAKGARRWLRWGSISIQPAEMVKLVAVIYLAAYLAKKSDKITLFRERASARVDRRRRVSAGSCCSSRIWAPSS